MRGFTTEDLCRIWDTYIKTYLDTDDEKLIKKAEEQLMAVTCARMLPAALAIPGLFEQRVIDLFKEIAAEYCDKDIEPICF